ncbi:MAG: serine/threonine protein kinase, partial [Bryobacterales bacterium]|nr:serine/threonine protein kinase [Bryobacterales bacterium]
MSELARPEDQDAQLWRTAYQLFEEALEHPEPARAAFARHQASDPNLLAIVLELLREYSEEDLDEAPSVHARLSPGSRVGRYEICAKLGRGGMGWVYSARDVELGRLVALKFLDTKSVSPNRLVQEAKAASALSHPNIVTIYELVRDGADVALVMELVDGQTMRELCGAPQPERRLANWGRQIACALAATHAMGIVHRDIKPENLMLRPDGFVKVLDFGLARRILGPASVTQASFSGALAGTFQYLSPEITRGESPGPPTDV